jgi:hypothetical protein
MAKQMNVMSKTPGLKAMASHRHLGAAKRYIPHDTDGAYRVEGRLDGVTGREVLALVRKRQAEEG